MKLHLGCGNIIKQGYVNVDAVQLPGVDVVADLNKFPWPFEDSSCEVIELHHLLEHLPDVFKAMEEMYRIAAPGGKVIITVPYWNSIDYATDPSHVHQFSQHSLNYFDDRTAAGKERPYYSKARFHIEHIDYITTFNFKTYIPVKNKLGKKLLAAFAYFFNNIIHQLTFYLKAVK